MRAPLQVETKVDGALEHARHLSPRLRRKRIGQSKEKAQKQRPKDKSDFPFREKEHGRLSVAECQLNEKTISSFCRYRWQALSYFGHRQSLYE